MIWSGPNDQSRCAVKLAPPRWDKRNDNCIACMISIYGECIVSIDKKLNQKWRDENNSWKVLIFVQ